ncbi:dihydrofolate reductase family protein [Kribbella sp. NPDC055110]
MGKLVYAAIASLDGYTADADGSFDWAAPAEEVHAYVNDLERPIGTYLYGSRMYATMSYWETADDPAPVSQDYAEVWRAADKIVYSRTLPAVTTARTRLEREFTPAGVAQLKESSATALSIGGANLGGQALLAGLVDEIHLFLVPVIVGGGTRALPDGLSAGLDLAAERRFAGGFVHLHYRVKN